MLTLVRLRLVAVLLAVVMSLGGTASPFAQRMATLDDLAIVEAMQLGATAADFCGKDGKSLLSSVTAQIGHASVDTLVPSHNPALIAIVLRFAGTISVPTGPLLARSVLDPGNGSRAPPALMA